MSRGRAKPRSRPTLPAIPGPWTPSEDFELHQALQEMAPAAVRKLVELGAGSGGDRELRDEALMRLRGMRASGLFDRLPLDLRREAGDLLRDEVGPDA
jgi:hypothetical protein